MKSFASQLRESKTWLDPRLNGKWQCVRSFRSNKEETDIDLTYTFNPDGSAASNHLGRVELEMSWGIEDYSNALCIKYHCRVESVGTLWHYEMPDQDTLVLSMTRNWYRVFKRMTHPDATKSPEDT